jgi:hypothetical protein
MNRAQLEAVADAPGLAGFVLLEAAAQGAGPWRLRPAQLAARLGCHPRTVRRALAELADGGQLAELADGRRAWGDAWPDDGGQFWRLSPELVARLRSLAELGRAARTTLRLALFLVPRLRAALAAGQGSIAVTNDDTARRLGMGRSALQGALARLCWLGLRVTTSNRVQATGDGWRCKPRRLATFCPPWAGELADDEPRSPGQTGTSAGQTRTATVPLGTLVTTHDIAREPAGLAEGGPTGPDWTAAREPEPELCPFPARGDRGWAGEGWGGPLASAAAVLADAGLRGRNLAIMARVARDGDTARAWLAQEAPALDTAHTSAGGLFWCLYRDHGSLPGRPSQLATDRRREREYARQSSELGERFRLRRGDDRDAEADRETLRALYRARWARDRACELRSEGRGGDCDELQAAQDEWRRLRAALAELGELAPYRVKLELVAWDDEEHREAEADRQAAARARAEADAYVSTLEARQARDREAEAAEHRKRDELAAAKRQRERAELADELAARQIPAQAELEALGGCPPNPTPSQRKAARLAGLRAWLGGRRPATLDRRR